MLGHRMASKPWHRGRALHKIHFAHLKHVFSNKIKGHHHLQGNVQVHNVRIPVVSLAVFQGIRPFCSPNCQVLRGLLGRPAGALSCHRPVSGLRHEAPCPSLGMAWSHPELKISSTQFELVVPSLKLVMLQNHPFICFHDGWKEI